MANCRAIFSISFDGQGAGQQPGAQVLALGQFHGQDGLAVDIFQAVDGGDVLVLQRSQDPRLALEAGQAVGILGQFARQDLQGDIPAQLGVAALVDLAHAAAADHFAHFVRTDGPSDHGWLPPEKRMGIKPLHFSRVFDQAAIIDIRYPKSGPFSGNRERRPQDEEDHHQGDDVFDQDGQQPAQKGVARRCAGWVRVFRGA